MAKSIYPNQFTVVSGKRMKTNSENLYAKMNLEALQGACEDLNGIALKLYLYLAKNREDFKLALSPTAARSWGIKKDSYYKAKDELIEKGYLVDKGNSVYEFWDAPEKVEYKKDELESIRDYDVKMMKSEVEWLEDDVVKLADGTVKRVLPF
jgi:hypothetical protein